MYWITWTEMKLRPKKDSVDSQILQFRRELLEEFGRLDLPITIKVSARNRAKAEGKTSLEALNCMLSEAGSLELLLQQIAKESRKIKRQAERTNNPETSLGLFGASTLLPGAPPLQGGAPGCGKSSR
jgi:hypothetical protein